MFDISRRITALEFALDYTPGQDDNHSHSVLLEMLDELREKDGPAAATARGPITKKTTHLFVRDFRRKSKMLTKKKK